MHSQTMLKAAALAAVAAAVPGTALAAPAKHRTCHSLTQAQLDTKFAEFNGAWATKNPDKVTALFDDDAVLLATVAAKPRTSPALIRDYFVSFLKNSPVGKIDTSTIKSGCGWALRAGTWTVTLTEPVTGANSDVKARYSFLYQREDGQWRIEHLHSSVLPGKD